MANVAPWLPGSKGKGVADLLVAGGQRHVFPGKLSFSWPAQTCQASLNLGDGGDAPLFAYGYGLNTSNRSKNS